LLRGLLEIYINLTRLHIGKNTVAVVFPFRLCLSHIVGDAPRVGEDVALVERQEGIQLLDPICHVHRNASHGLAFGEDEVLLDEIIECGQLRLSEVILGDRDILLANRCAAPVRQPDVGLGRVHPVVNDLGGGLTGDRPVHFVLGLF